MHLLLSPTNRITAWNHHGGPREGRADLYSLWSSRLGYHLNAICKKRNMRAIKVKLNSSSTLLLLVFLFLLLTSISIFTTRKTRQNIPEPVPIKDSNVIEESSLGDHISLQSLSKCGNIHIALVCGGFNSTRSLYVLLKSILFYRSDNISLHLFVDNVSRKILQELFRTWSQPELEVTYYNLTEHEPKISWITSQHYSHNHGLLKLVFLSILPMDKVILMDTDMLALGDIRHLWQALETMESYADKPLFGMVENQSDWYLKSLPEGHMVWPAVGRGFNSGLILANLKELRLRNWHQLWRRVAEVELVSHLVAPLADQDIFNAVIRSQPSIVRRLPCSFNLQLNDNNKLDDLCPEMEPFQLIHWNSPNKLESRNSYSDHYKNWYLTFENWSAALLMFNRCGFSPSNDTSESHSYQSILCKDIRPRPKDKLRTFLYFIGFDYTPSRWDVSLVVHLSSDRLQVLDQLAANWLGPISAAIYLTEMETSLLMFTIQSSTNLALRRNIGYHLVFRDHGFNYPINKMRNIALNNALTDYVLLSDVDFLPSKNLYDYLKLTLATSADISKNPLAKRALVVPAFETLQYRFEFPVNKAELLMQLNLGSISMFREQLWPRGHAPTDYSRWKIATKPYKVEWQPDYEPFIVTSKDVPRFDERFVGFGWNKVESITHLAALGYEFIVLPEAFLVHKFHSASYDIIKHRESIKYRACIRYLKKQYLEELRSKYPDFFKALNSTSQNKANK